MALQTSAPIYRGPSHEALTLALMEPYPFGTDGGTRRVTFMDEDGRDYIVRVFQIHTTDGDNLDILGVVVNIPDHPTVRMRYSVFTRKGMMEILPAEGLVECYHCHAMVPNDAKCRECGHVMCP